ncbi:MAG: CocE/NonD family hydrolase [Gemmatimonadetes bacterium]|nr:CocE/NonD family hydrolase [Gemmatimonadota bacterium]
MWTRLLQLALPLLLVGTGAWAQGRSPDGEVVLDTASIPMPDGARLAVDLWRPTAAGPLPVLLEYLPYRKDEARADRYALYAYFVRRGYVVARVDIRGTGNSSGRLIPHEYSDIELTDGDAVIAWLAKQPFSTGAVGMFGISWSGFNALMMARRRPPALKAIIALHATEELYQEDVHLMDGMMHVDSWEMSQDLSNLMPGAPAYRIDAQYFADRFDQPPWFLTYKRQQRDGPFWDRASLRTDYGALATPTLLIGGWYDGYRDAVPRLLTNLRAPVKAIIGPWSHVFPHRANPGPGVEWRHEAVRWFDHWLKEAPTGVRDDPALRVFVREYHPPGPDLPTTPGFWRSEPTWPLTGLRDTALFPGVSGTLGDRPGSGRPTLRYDPGTGVEAGGPVMWFGDVTPDLAPGDRSALNFDTEPLAAPLEILGLPRAVLSVSATARQAHWLVRLSDVAPDGRVTLVASAGQNGAHRRSARSPEAIVPGVRFPLEIEMHATSWVFPAGHRLRLSVTNAQWPMIWPTPDPMTTTLFLGGDTRVVLPVVPAGYARATPAWAPIDTTPDPWPGYQWLDRGTTSGFGEVDRVERDPRTGRSRVIASSSSARRLPWGEEESSERITHETWARTPSRTSVHGEYETIVRLPDRTLRWAVDVRVRSDRTHFHYVHRRRLWNGATLVRERRWSTSIPRDHQ